MLAALKYHAACECDPLSWVKDAKSSTVKPSLQNRASEEKWHSNLLEGIDWNTWISTSQKLFHFGQISHQTVISHTISGSRHHKLLFSEHIWPIQDPVSSPWLVFSLFLLLVQHQFLLIPLGSHGILSTITTFTIFIEIMCLWACLAHEAQRP